MNRLLKTITTTLAILLSASVLAAPEQPKLTIAVGGKPLFYYLPLAIAVRRVGRWSGKSGWSDLHSEI